MRPVPWILLGLIVGCGGGGDSPSDGGSALIPGSLVSSFGDGGIATSNPGEFEDEIVDMEADATALYLVGTYEAADNDMGWRIEKRDRFTGALLAAVATNPSDRDEYPNAATMDATYLYVVGSDRTTVDGNSRWRIEKRRLSDLSLVDSFGTDGVVLRNLSGGDDEARGVAVDSGHVYVVGYRRVAGDDDQWHIDRYNVDTGGLQMFTSSNPTAQIDRARAIAIDTHYLYVAGVQGIGAGVDGRWRIEKRRLSNFALDAAFGAGGVVSVNPSPDSDVPNAIALDATSMIVVGNQGSGMDGSRQWRIEKRLLSNGASDPAFGAGGALTFDFSESSDAAHTVALDGPVLYVGGGDRSPGNGRWRIEKRYLTDGSLVSSFGAAGSVVVDPTAGDDWLATVLPIGSDLYAAGMDTAGEGQWRVERRVK